MGALYDRVDYTGVFEKMRQWPNDCFPARPRMGKGLINTGINSDTIFGVHVARPIRISQGSWFCAMPLTFSDFGPVGLAFEIRYPDAYLLWDHAGQLTQELRERHEVTRLLTALPGKIAFIADATREVSWELERLIVLDHQPKTATFDAFFTLCEDCFEITTRNLLVSEVKRVGFRPTFSKKFANKEEAAAALLATGLLHVPTGKNFNVAPTNQYPEYAIRCESEKFGYMLKLVVQEVNYEFEPPPHWRGNVVEPTHEERLTFDFDYYSRATMPVGSLKVSEWLSQVIHLIRRDADSYLVR